MASKEISKSQRASQEASIKSISLVTLPFCFAFPSVPYVAFFVLTSAPFVASSPMFHPIHLPLPFVSPRSFRFVLPFLSALTSDSFTSSFSQVVHFVTSFLLFSVLPSVRLPLPFLSAHPFHCVRPFVATLPFHSLLPSLR